MTKTTCVQGRQSRHATGSYDNAPRLAFHPPKKKLGYYFLLVPSTSAILTNIFLLFFAWSTPNTHEISIEKRLLSGHDSPGALVRGRQRITHCRHSADSRFTWARLDGAHDEMVVCPGLCCAGRLRGGLRRLLPQGSRHVRYQCRQSMRLCADVQLRMLRPWQQRSIAAGVRSEEHKSEPQA